MNREEFLRLLCEALEGKVSEQVLNENLRYYKEYINNQILNGKSEQEVLRELGEPRLIAKTIEDSNRFADNANNDIGDNGYKRQYYANSQENYGDDIYDGKTGKTSGWITALLLVFVLIFSVTAVFKIFIVFLPFILFAVLATLVYKIIKSVFK